MKKESGYKGVHWVVGHQKFRAAIQHNGEEYHCGYYDDPRIAAKARDMKILQFNLDRKKLQVLKPI